MWPLVLITIGILGAAGFIFLVVRARTQTPIDYPLAGLPIMVVGICMMGVTAVLAILGDWGWYMLPIGIVFVAVGAQRQRSNR